MLFSYRAHVYHLYVEAIAKAAKAAMAHAACVAAYDLKSESPQEFEQAHAEWEARFSDLDSHLKTLYETVPESLMDGTALARHMFFCRKYIKERHPRSVGNDPISILERDIPSVMRAFDNWYEAQSNLDRRFADRLEPFASITHVNSAVREAWVVFKTRCVHQFGLSAELDGERLITKLFGTGGVVRGVLDDAECEGYMNLLRGLYLVSRNPLAHNDLDPNPAVADAVLTLISHTLARLEEDHAAGSA